MQRLDKALEIDEIYCPMSKLPMRHPIKLSSRYHCELEMLVKAIQTSKMVRCPHSRQKITSFSYNKDLKEKLDIEFADDDTRYEDYHHIDELLTQLNNMVFPFKNAAKSAFFIGTLGGLSAYYFISNLFQNETHQDQINYSLMLSTTAAAVDFGCRYFSLNEFGIFGGMQRMAESFKDRLANDQPNEEYNAFMNTVLLGSI